MLRRHEVQAVYLFGSRAAGSATEKSDYDYAVLLKTPGHKKGDSLYQEIYEHFSACSPRSLANDVIDIVFLREAGLELRFHVISLGIVIWEADPEGRLEFEVQTELLYCDYRPILEQMDKDILEAV
jgi:predicted nucleotidyltransferase